MARTPNYDFERKERERQKVAKAAEKVAAKRRRPADEDGSTESA